MMRFSQFVAESKSLLKENLGNLAFLDQNPELLKRAKQLIPLSDLGQNSAMRLSHSLSRGTWAKITEMLISPEVGGMLIKVAGKPYGLLLKHAMKHGQAMLACGTLMDTGVPLNPSVMYAFPLEKVIAKLKAFVKSLRFHLPDISVEFFMIMVDINRKIMSSQRKRLGKGVVPLPSDGKSYDDYTRGLKANLLVRLGNYLSKKAASNPELLHFTSIHDVDPAKLAKVLIGPLKVVKIGDFVYKLIKFKSGSGSFYGKKIEVGPGEVLSQFDVELMVSDEDNDKIWNMMRKGTDPRDVPRHITFTMNMVINFEGLPPKVTITDIALN